MTCCCGCIVGVFDVESSSMVMVSVAVRVLFVCGVAHGSNVFLYRSMFAYSIFVMMCFLVSVVGGVFVNLRLSFSSLRKRSSAVCILHASASGDSSSSRYLNSTVSALVSFCIVDLLKHGNVRISNSWRNLSVLACVTSLVISGMLRMNVSVGDFLTMYVDRSVITDFRMCSRLSSVKGGLSWERICLGPSRLIIARSLRSGSSVIT